MITILTPGYVYWDGTKYSFREFSGTLTGPASGDLSGDYPSPTVTALEGNALPPLTIGNLNWTGSNWAFTPSPTTLPPSGAAGGDLAGTYPNPTLATIITAAGPIGSSTTSPVITVDAKGRVISITSAAIAFPAALPPDGYATGDLSGSYPNPTVSGIQGIHVPAPTSPNTILKYIGGSLLWSTPSSTYNVTDVAFANSPYHVLTTDNVISVDSSGGAISVVLPAIPNIGDSYIIKDSTGQAPTHNINVSGGAINIDGSSSYTMQLLYESLTVIYNGSQWLII